MEADSLFIVEYKYLRNMYNTETKFRGVHCTLFETIQHGNNMTQQLGKHVEI